MKTHYVITTHNAEMSGFFIAGKGATPEAAEAAADLCYERGGNLTGIYEQTHAINAETMTGREAQKKYGHFVFSWMCVEYNDRGEQAEYEQFLLHEQHLLDSTR